MDTARLLKFPPCIADWQSAPRFTSKPPRTATQDGVPGTQTDGQTQTPFDCPHPGQRPLRGAQCLLRAIWVGDPDHIIRPDQGVVEVEYVQNSHILK